MIFLNQKSNFENFSLTEEHILQEISNVFDEYSIKANIEPLFFNEMSLYDTPTILYFTEEVIII